MQYKSSHTYVNSVILRENETIINISTYTSGGWCKISSDTYMVDSQGVKYPIRSLGNARFNTKYYNSPDFELHFDPIPFGINMISVIEPGGWSWINIEINNLSEPVPNIKSDSLSYDEWEKELKQLISLQDDGVVGIYEGNNYTLACIQHDGKYKLINMIASEGLYWWKAGDIKAVLRSSATPGLFKADWYMANRSLNKEVFITFEKGGMNVVFDDGGKNFYLKMFPSFDNNGNKNTHSANSEWSGTGFALKDGYIVTNYHVVEDAKNINIQGISGDFNSKHSATVVAADKFNDIAILKLDNSNIKVGNIPYAVKTSMADVGEDVFVLGFPLTSTMGEEIKLTTGIVSSKTGYQGDVSLYQISAPVQPGNSGGPLFDTNGNVIGIVSSKHQGAENVGYAIKVSYLKNLMESVLSNNILPQTNAITSQKLSDKVSAVKNYVYYITCTN